MRSYTQELETQNAELKAQLTALHRRQFKANRQQCANCQRPVIQSAEGEMLNGPIGLKTKALAVFLLYGMRGNLLKNWEKHGVAAFECEQVFFNRPLISAPDEAHSSVEPRLYALGQTDASRLLFIALRHPRQIRPNISTGIRPSGLSFQG